MYKNPSFALLWHDNKIIITINLPLSITRRSLTLFKVTALRLLTDDQDLHASFMQGLPRYMAYSETEDLYLELVLMPKLDNGIYPNERNPFPQLISVHWKLNFKQQMAALTLPNLY
jgi:hypothetical protein